jgi:hypothetical protein
LETKCGPPSACQKGAAEWDSFSEREGTPAIVPRDSGEACTNVGDMQGYVNLKGYGEFDNNARPDGFNAWLTFALTPKAPTPSSEKSMATK